MQKILIVVLLLPFISHAQSPEIRSAGLGENIPSLACLACAGTEWNNLSYINAEDDSVATTEIFPAGNCFMSFCEYSRYLYASHFDFDIPADAVIDTILVDIRRTAHDQNALMDSTVRLAKKGTLVGNNLNSPGFWPTTLTYHSYGHDDPLWGTTWLPSDLNDTATGVSLKVMNLASSNAKADVDHIRMTVHYSTSTGTYSVTSTPSDMEWVISSEGIDMNIFTPISVTCESKIFNSAGQEVVSIYFGKSIKGENHFQCSTDLLARGIYFIVMNAGGKIYSRKFVAAK
ncbi:MAG TPA: T9SS type A sorting domain-containing protein [Saprospiraceae bacterium]|nr:T9SS type A sorting domain-containing protein [Saprospiraceae bacterium]